MAKKNKDMDVSEEKAGNKLVTLLIALVIVIIWLAVFVLLIKFDVGGFGSGVLRPLLKDVPVVNKILPDPTAEELESEGTYKYRTLKEAVERIDELELELDSINETGRVNSDYVKELEEEVKRLQAFESDQEAFKERVRRFDTNVVYAEEAPDIEEYRTYYEEIQPDNAAEIYRQVIQDIRISEKVASLAKSYSNMEPDKAAEVLTIMTANDLELVCDIIGQMKAEVSAPILAAMDSATAAKITKAMSTR